MKIQNSNQIKIETSILLNRIYSYNTELLNNELEKKIHTFLL